MKWIKLSVACFVVCVLKCSAKSLNDIEEFSEFLLKTSQLDEILKKGHNPDDDSDEDEPVSDHAWEESGKFEGDLILNERQRRLIIEDVAEGLSRNGLKDSTKRWPDNEVIYYIQKEHFSGDQVQAIQSGIDDIAQASCVKFRPYKKGDRDAVVIQGSRRGCFSQVGYQGGYQVLNLSGRHPVGRGCFRHGTVVHELLHTLGFYHMQSSPDRDDYIDVIWENIIQPARHNFRKYNSFAVSDFGVGYDYDSVLHYSRRAFSANGGDTLVPKQNGASIGQRIGLSDKDTQKLNKMYCDADSNNSDAEEDTAKKSATKKKSPKNKPFEGHGIGYHQGKTVVIKLPAAETYKLPDLPTFHVFDYFSKTPQTVSPALIEGIGFGKEIEYTYQPELHTEKYDEKIATLHNSQTLPNDNHNNSNNENNYQGNIDKSIKPSIHDNAGIVKPEDQKISEESSPEPEGSSGPFEKVDDDLSEAFERLGKIIKTHVYPSQTPNLSVYKMADYNEFYTPPKKFTTDPEIHKEIHKDTSISDMESSTEYDYGYDRVVAPDKKPQQFIKNLYGPESSSPDKQNNDVIRKDTSLSDNESSTEDEHRYDRVTVPDEKLHRFIQNLYEPKSSSPDKQNNDAIHNDTSLSEIKSSTEDEHSYDRITVPDEKPHRFIQNLYELKNSTPDKPNEDEIHKGTSISDMESSTEYEHSYDRVTVPNEKPHRFIQNLYQSKSSSPDKQNNDSIHKDTFLSDNESSTEDEHSYDRITVPDEKPHRFIQNLYEPKNSTPNKPNEDEIHKGTSLSDIKSSTEDGHSYDRVTVLDEKPHRFIQNLDESKSSSPEKQNNDSIHKDTFLSDIESSIYEHSYDRVTVPDEKPHRFIQNLNEPQNSSLDKQNNDAILEHFKMKNPTSDDTSISFYDTPKSRATDLSSSKPANPLNEMILTNKHKMLTPKYATFEHLRHKPNYINSYYPGTEDNSNFKTKRIHTLLGYVVPLKDNWIKKYEKFEQKHRDIDSDQNKDKSDRPHTSRISDRDSGFENSRSPIPSGNQAFSIYGVLVPFSENWHKEDYDPHKNSYSIDKSESHEDNR